MGQVVVVRVAYYYDVYDGGIMDLAGNRGVPFRAHEGQGTTAFFKNGVKEDAQARGVFDVVAGVAEPGCA